MFLEGDHILYNWELAKVERIGLKTMSLWFIDKGYRRHVKCNSHGLRTLLLSTKPVKTSMEVVAHSEYIKRYLLPNGLTVEYGDRTNSYNAKPVHRWHIDGQDMGVNKLWERLYGE